MVSGVPRTLSADEIQAFRADLCAAATRRFAEAGYGGVTLRGLAAELGVSPMTPYRYFRNKEDIFGAVRDAAFERLGLSAAALHRVLRVARTVADLAGAERLGAAHVAEAVQVRPEGTGW